MWHHCTGAPGIYHDNNGDILLQITQLALLQYLENDSAIFNIMFFMINGNLQFCSAWQDNEYPGSYKLGPIKNKERD